MRKTLAALGVYTLCAAGACAPLAPNLPPPMSTPSDVAAGPRFEHCRGRAAHPAGRTLRKGVAGRRAQHDEA